MALLAQHRLGSSIPLGLSGQALSSFPVASRQRRRYVYPCRVAKLGLKSVFSLRQYGLEKVQLCCRATFQARFVTKLRQVSC